MYVITTRKPLRLLSHLRSTMVLSMGKQTESYPVWIFLIFCQKDFLQMPDFWSFSNLVHISTGYIRFYLNHQIIGLLQDAEDREMHVEQSKRMLLLQSYLVTFKVLVYTYYDSNKQIVTRCYQSRLTCLFPILKMAWNNMPSK